ncbi:MAG: hypothetical protein JNM28_04965 [Armatimonadetes bacterium]|nr:hypothetical protein [Armatimonadota bacterium]MBS1712472.1 hypothetical protein [Armatimonadota bacterium]MBX3109219.1 hypothetical protein [Fimbriimonadaceae bacterium]
MQPQPVDPYAAQSKRSMLGLGIGIGVLATLLLIGGGMAALGLLGPQSKVLPQVAGNQSVLPSVPGDPSPALPLEAIKNEPALPKPQEAIRMPDDVYNWLEHLRKTENMRKSMAGDQIGELTVMMTKMKTSSITDAMKGLFSPDESPIPIDEKQPDKDSLVVDAGKKREQWKQLNDFFLSYPPPDECKPIQASYAQALGETGAMIVEILEAVDMASESPDKAIAALTKMQGTSGGRIDQLAKQTDDQVNDICNKYQTRKWFGIQGDVGGGFLSQLGGF